MDEHDINKKWCNVSFSAKANEQELAHLSDKLYAILRNEIDITRCSDLTIKKPEHENN